MTRVIIYNRLHGQLPWSTIIAIDLGNRISSRQFIKSQIILWGQDFKNIFDSSLRGHLLFKFTKDNSTDIFKNYSLQLQSAALGRHDKSARSCKQLKNKRTDTRGLRTLNVMYANFAIKTTGLSRDIIQKQVQHLMINVCLRVHSTYIIRFFCQRGKRFNKIPLSLGTYNLWCNRYTK